MFLLYTLFIPVIQGDVYIYGETLSAEPLVKIIDEIDRLELERDDSRYFIVPITHLTRNDIISVHRRVFHSSLGGSVIYAPQYTCFVYDLLVANRTTHLGALLGVANVKYVLLRLDTTEFPYTLWSITGPPRRTGHLLVGESSGFKKLLSLQQGLKPTKCEENFILYENTKYIPHVMCYRHLLSIIGDRITMERLCDVPRFSFKKIAVIFLNQIPYEKYADLSSYIVFHESSLDDFRLNWIAYNAPQYLINLEKAKYDGWHYVNVRDYLLKRPFISGFFAINDDLLEAVGDAVLEARFMVNNNATYEIWMRIGLSPHLHASMEISIDEKDTYSVVIDNISTPIGLRWIKVCSLVLKPREHTLIVKNRDSRCVIDEIAIIPPDAHRLRLPSKHNLILIFEPELFKQHKITDSYQLSGCEDTTNWWVGGENGSILLSEDKKEGNYSIHAKAISTFPYPHARICVGLNFVAPQNWTSYDLLQLWIKASTRKIWVTPILSDGSVPRIWVFDVEPFKWNLIEIPLNYTYKDVISLRVYAITEEPGKWAELYIDDIHLCKILGTEYSRHIFVPVNSVYTLSIKVPGLFADEICGWIDDNIIKLRKIGRNWYECSNITLTTRGNHLSFFINGTNKPQVIVIHEGLSIYSLFEENLTEKFKFEVNKMHDTIYIVNLQADGDIFIVLGESFHTGWTAYFQDQPLLHFPAFSLTNGFYLNASGYHQITIKFKPQSFFIIYVYSVIGVFLSSLGIATYEALREYMRKIHLREKG